MDTNPKIGRIKKVHYLQPIRKLTWRFQNWLKSKAKHQTQNLYHNLRHIQLFKLYFKICVVFSLLFVAKVIYVEFEDTINTYASFAKEQVVNENFTYSADNEIFAQKIGEVRGDSTVVYLDIRAKANTINKRAYILDMYFQANNSPLYGTGQLFVNACDKYGAPKDCISVVAIAKHETNLCKYYYSAEMYNCWGYGGGGANRIKFGSFEESIDRVTSTLVNQYGIEYMIDPRKMERTFCGPQDECIGWGSRILKIMKDVDDFSATVGMGRLTEYR